MILINIRWDLKLLWCWNHCLVPGCTHHQSLLVLCRSWCTTWGFSSLLISKVYNLIQLVVFDSTEKVWWEVFHQWFHRQTLNTFKCQTSFWWVMGNKKGQIVQEVLKLSFWELLENPTWHRWCCASCQPSPCGRTTSRWREAQGTRTCACALSASWKNV